MDIDPTLTAGGESVGPCLCGGFSCDRGGSWTRSTLLLRSAHAKAAAILWVNEEAAREYCPWKYWLSMYKPPTKSPATSAMTFMHRLLRRVLNDPPQRSRTVIGLGPLPLPALAAVA
jgi:hypothetical protein